jgi:hypothetical protein
LLAAGAQLTPELVHRDGMLSSQTWGLWDTPAAEAAVAVGNRVYSRTHVQQLGACNDAVAQYVTVLSKLQQAAACQPLYRQLRCPRLQWDALGPGTDPTSGGLTGELRAQRKVRRVDT